MKIIETTLEGAYIIEQSKFFDDRGFFIESYNKRDLESVLNVEFVQDNHSQSTINVLRGLHYQIENPQGKLVRCMRGWVTDVIVDLRESSPDFGQHTIVQLNRPEVMLWVPPGFAHGFVVRSDKADVSYKTTDYYYKEHDRTLLWNDPDLNIDWDVKDPILSEKDKRGKTLQECDKYD
jgi:dTDP-4-dehydrorhamnose 3,5-epimerase